MFYYHRFHPILPPRHFVWRWPQLCLGPSQPSARPFAQVLEFPRSFAAKGAVVLPRWRRWPPIMKCWCERWGRIVGKTVENSGRQGDVRFHSWIQSPTRSFLVSSKEFRDSKFDGCSWLLCLDISSLFCYMFQRSPLGTSISHGQVKWPHPPNAFQWRRSVVLGVPPQHLQLPQLSEWSKQFPTSTACCCDVSCSLTTLWGDKHCRTSHPSQNMPRQCLFVFLFSKSFVHVVEGEYKGSIVCNPPCLGHLSFMNILNMFNLI